MFKYFFIGLLFSSFATQASSLSELLGVANSKVTPSRSDINSYDPNEDWRNYRSKALIKSFDQLADFYRANITGISRPTNQSEAWQWSSSLELLLESLGAKFSVGHNNAYCTDYFKREGGDLLPTILQYKISELNNSPPHFKGSPSQNISKKLVDQLALHKRQMGFMVDARDSANCMRNSAFIDNLVIQVGQITDKINALEVAARIANYEKEQKEIAEAKLAAAKLDTINSENALKAAKERAVIDETRRDQETKSAKLKADADAITNALNAKLAKEKADQDAIIREKTLKAEKEKADEEASQRRIETAKRAQQFLTQSKTSWSLRRQTDSMSGATLTSAVSTFKFNTATVEGVLTCDTSLRLVFTVQNAKFPVILKPYGNGISIEGYAPTVPGRLKVNDKIKDVHFSISEKFSNVASTYIYADRIERNSIWGVMIEIPTNKGDTLFYLPSADKAVSAVFDSCK